MIEQIAAGLILVFAAVGVVRSLVSLYWFLTVRLPEIMRKKYAPKEGD